MTVVKCRHLDECRSLLQQLQLTVAACQQFEVEGQLSLELPMAWHGMPTTNHRTSLHLCDKQFTHILTLSIPLLLLSLLNQPQQYNSNHSPVVQTFDYSSNEKKRLEEMQTLHAGCSKVEPKISLRQRPPSQGVGRLKFNQLEMVTTFTYKPSLVRIDACNFELSW